MKSFNIFREINKLFGKKLFKYFLYIFVLGLIVFSYLKDHKNDVEKIQKDFLSKRGIIEKKINDIKGIEDNNQNKKYIYDSNKEIPENRDLDNSEKKIVKKNIIPEEKYLNIEKEEKINKQVILLSKFNELKDIYKYRQDNKKIDYTKRVKLNDYVFYNLKIILKLKNTQTNEEETNKMDFDNGIDVFGKVNKEDKFTYLFLGKKIGATIKISSDNLLDLIDKDKKKQILDSKKELEENFKQFSDEGININDITMYYEYKLLDIIPNDVVLKLELQK